MKKNLILLLIVLMSCDTENNFSESIKNFFTNIQYSIVHPTDYSTKFVFGQDSISKLIYSNMKLTDQIGTVWVSLDISMNGNIENVKIYSSENERLNSEALRLAKLIPDEWKPAELGLETLKTTSEYIFPIRFDEAVKTLYSEQKENTN